MTMVVVLENLNFSALCFVSDILDGFWEDIRFFLSPVEDVLAVAMSSLKGHEKLHIYTPKI